MLSCSLFIISCFNSPCTVYNQKIIDDFHGRIWMNSIALLRVGFHLEGALRNPGRTYLLRI